MKKILKKYWLRAVKNWRDLALAIGFLIQVFLVYQLCALEERLENIGWVVGYISAQVSDANGNADNAASDIQREISHLRLRIDELETMIRYSR